MDCALSQSDPTTMVSAEVGRLTWCQPLPGWASTRERFASAGDAGGSRVVSNSARFRRRPATPADGCTSGCAGRNDPGQGAAEARGRLFEAWRFKARIAAF